MKSEPQLWDFESTLKRLKKGDEVRKKLRSYFGVKDKIVAEKPRAKPESVTTLSAHKRSKVIEGASPSNPILFPLFVLFSCLLLLGFLLVAPTIDKMGGFRAGVPIQTINHVYPTQVVVHNVTNEIVKERIVTSGEKTCLSVRDVSNGKTYLECEQ